MMAKHTKNRFTAARTQKKQAFFVFGELFQVVVIK
jgi:hypothetical protein